VESGNEIRAIDGTLSGIAGEQADLALSPDGGVLALKGVDGWIHLWSTDTGKQIREFNKSENQTVTLSFRGQIGTICFSPNGKTLATAWLRIVNGNIDAFYQMWDVVTGKKKAETREENAGYNTMSVVFSPDGRFLARTGMDGFVHLVDAQSGERLRRIGDPGDMPRFAFSPDGRTLAIESLSERSVGLWDPATGKKVSTLLEAFTPAFARSPFVRGSGLAFSRAGKVLAVARDHSVRLLDARSGRHLQSVFGHEAPITRLQFSPDGRWLTTKADDGTMFVWDSASGKEREQVRIAGGMAAGLVLMSPDGRTLANGSLENKVELRDLATPRDSRWIVGEKTGFSQIAFSPDSSWLALQEQGTGTVCLFSVASGKELRRMDAPLNETSANQPDFTRSFRVSGGLIVSPDGSRLASAVDGSTLGIWNTNTGRLLSLIRLPANFLIRGIAFTPDNRSLATAARDNSVTLWEIATAQPRRVFGRNINDDAPMPPVVRQGRAGGRNRPGGMIFTDAASSLMFSHDGRLLYQGRPDKAVVVWDIVAGNERCRLTGHGGDILALALAPDGKRLASGSSDTTALVWDVADLATEPSTTSTLASGEVEARWSALGSTDSAKAFDAICALSTSPSSALPYLQKNLRPADPTPGAQIEHWIADLDHDQYKLRERADQELEKLGEIAEEPLRKALHDKPSPEAQERIEQLLNKIGRQALPSAACLRELRVIEVLERMAGAESRELLQALASGGAGALRTRLAQESLRRLGVDRK
jgi:WD40 repeat protein